jgi:hypothetical protein
MTLILSTGIPMWTFSFPTELGVTTMEKTISIANKKNADQQGEKAGSFL